MDWLYWFMIFIMACSDTTQVWKIRINESMLVDYSLNVSSCVMSRRLLSFWLMIILMACSWGVASVSAKFNLLSLWTKKTLSQENEIMNPLSFHTCLLWHTLDSHFILCKNLCSLKLYQRSEVILGPDFLGYTASNDILNIFTVFTVCYTSLH